MPRPAVPTELKILRGNPGKRPIKDDEPEAGEITTRPPAGLDVVARREWGRMVRKFGRLGVVKETDAEILSLYCQTYSRWRAAEAAIAEDGLAMMTPTGYRLHPCYSVSRDAALMMKSLLLEFGGSPASRTKVSVEKPPEESGLAKFRKDTAAR